MIDTQFRRGCARAALALALSLTVIAPAQAGDDQPLKVSGQDALRGTGKVVVGAFNVGFIFESVDQTKATGGLMGAFGGTTKAKSELVGVTPAMMQQVADAAYADFVGRLTAAGFTVDQPAALFGSAEFARAKPQAAPLDINIALEKGSKGKATYYKPGALPALVMLPGDFVGSGMSSIGINMAAGQSQGALAGFAKANGEAVIDVVYLIDFSAQKRPGAFSFGGLEVNANLSVSPDYSRMSVISAGGKTATVVLKQAVSVDGDFIDKRDATSGASKTTQAVGNVLGGLAAARGFGGFGFGKTRTLEFNAKPGSYEQGAAKAASLANERLVGLIAASK